MSLIIPVRPYGIPEMISGMRAVAWIQNIFKITLCMKQNEFSPGGSSSDVTSYSPEVPRISDLAGWTAAQRAIIGPLRPMRSRLESSEGAIEDLHA